MENQEETIIRINGQDYLVNLSNLNKLTELLDSLSPYIDPEHMIVDITFNGNNLEETDWDSSIKKFSGGVFEIKTDSPKNFAISRLKESPYIVNAILKIIREARLLFAEGRVREANDMMVKGVNALKEFFNWFGVISRLLDPEMVKIFDISEVVENLANQCEKVANAQIYQSWWGISETLKNQVEPILDELETFLRKTLRSQAL